MQTNCASGGWASNRFFEPRSRPAMAWRPPRSPTWTSCGGMFLNIRQSRHGRRPAAGSSGASRSPRGWRRRGRSGRRRAACSSAGKAQLSFQVREAGSRCTAWARRRLRCTCGAVVYSQWEPFDTKTLGKDGQHAQLLGSEQSIGSCELQETLDGLTEDQGSQGDGGADPEIGQQCIARDDEELLQEDCLAEKLDWTASAHRLLLVSAEATGQQPFARRRARLDRERRDRDVAQLCASFMEVIGR
ncbi:unnamed protein product [Prorocentrum cordatum]|uniref:Uncharacterized protein n=1 Tax=Prorocentrum cordatum TaxID=2364126 RepID=A0ABN9W0Y7_9DINO|nr:unnamed protein product [Polarella glacialis]